MAIMARRKVKKWEVVNLGSPTTASSTTVPLSRVMLVQTGFPLTPWAKAAMEGTNPLIPSPMR